MEIEENRSSTRKKTLKSGWDRLKLNPRTIAGVGGAYVARNAILTPTGVQHRDTRYIFVDRNEHWMALTIVQVGCANEPHSDPPQGAEQRLHISKMFTNVDNPDQQE